MPPWDIVGITTVIIDICTKQMDHREGGQFGRLFFVFLNVVGRFLCSAILRFLQLPFRLVPELIVAGSSRRSDSIRNNCRAGPRSQ
jgi:hypothetical protein